MNITFTKQQLTKELDFARRELLRISTTLTRLELYYDLGRPPTEMEVDGWLFGDYEITDALEIEIRANKEKEKQERMAKRAAKVAKSKTTADILKFPSLAGPPLD